MLVSGRRQPLNRIEEELKFFGFRRKILLKALLLMLQRRYVCVAEYSQPVRTQLEHELKRFPSARKGLQEFAERFLSKKLKVDQAVVYGHRSKEIVNYAINNRIDLIIMASHRIDPDRPGHDWSSISYAVAILAPCPVLLVK